MQTQGIRLTSAATGTQQCVVCIARPTKSLSVAMETQHCVPFAMSGHEIIHTAVNIHLHIRYLYFCPILTKICGFSADFCVSLQYQIS